jgi:nucleotide-binding universal stress UspA family protein
MNRTCLSQQPGTNACPALESGSAGAIIVGLGDTARGADALALAQLLADSLGAPLVPVHSQARDGSQVKERVADRGRAVLARADSAADGLRQIAEQENAQLIVIGPSPPSGLGRLRPRSVGERLLSETRLPVAIAPRGYARAERSLSLITSAFDGSHESLQALEWAAHLTMSSAGRLRVVSVHAPIPVTGLGFTAQSVEPGRRQGLEREQAAAIAAVGGPVEALVRDGSPARELVEASREADLLVMGSRGRGPLPEALLGSVAHYVVRRAVCPVVIHPPQAGRRLP